MELDIGDAVGNGIATGFACRKLDDHGLALIEQDAIKAATGGILRIHCDRDQAGTRTKRSRIDIGDAAANEDIG